MIQRACAFHLLIVFGLSVIVAAQPIFLVEDLEAPSANVSSWPLRVVSDGQVAYFSAEDDLYGRELWTSDGTTAGTRRLADVCAGRCSSSPQWIVPTGERVFFLADDGARGSELWMHDDSIRGTRLVRDLCPGVCSPTVWAITAFEGDVYLFLRAEGGGFELWRADGTPLGTRRLLAVEGFVSPFPALGDHLYFLATTGAHGAELWRTDGTAAGSELFRDLCPGPCDSDPVPVAVFRGELYFSADDGIRGLGLWKTDGTAAGTVRIADVPEGLLAPGAYNTAAVGDFLYFSSSTCFGMPCILRTDGTPGADLSAEEVFPHGSEAVRWDGFRAVGDRLFFGSEPPGSGEVELWVSDGTPGGAELLAGGFERWPTLFASLGDELFLGADQGTTGGEPWISDGTPAGTRLLRDVRPGPGSSFLQSVVEVGGRLLFVADDGSVGIEPWVSDATPEGTVLLADLRPEAASSSPHALTRFGDRLLFVSTLHDGSVWSTTGVPGSAIELTADLQLGGVPRSEIAVAGDRALFSSGFDSRLWSSAGTAASTFQLEGLFEVDNLTAAGDEVFFAAQGVGQQLWASDGTQAGTRLVHEVHPGWFDICGLVSPPCPHPPPMPHALAAVGEAVYFSAFAEGAGPQLWKSDGSEAGTVVVREFALGGGDQPEYHLPHELTAADGRLFFTAYETATGWGLWRSDGSEAGTFRLAGLGHGPELGPAHLVAVGNAVYFSLQRADGGDELWRSNGTPAGTFKVADLRLDGEGSNVVAATASGGRLFLSVLHPTTGAELWTSDGTAAGTRLVADLRPGVPGSSPSGLLGLGDGRVLFSADDGIHGAELWVSDGSAAGTVQVEDLAPGPVPSSPGELTRFGDRVFFAANDGASGRELFGLEIADLGDPPPPLPCPGDRLCLGGRRFEVTVSWRDFEGDVGPGVPVPGASDDSGLFWFFDSENWELMVKVLDGCAVNGHFWVLAAATTNVEYSLTVTDTLAPPEAVVYGNSLGQASPAIIDTRAFLCP